MLSIRHSLFTLIAAASLFGVGCAHSQQVAVAKPVTPATPAPEAKAEPAPAPKTDEAARAEVDLEDLLRGTVIHFDYDADVLTAESRQRLDTLAEQLHRRPDLKIKISGNCDERGTEEYNMALGDRRARSVASYLQSLGASQAQVATVSYGKENPECQEHDEACWARNRRAALKAGTAGKTKK